MAEADLKSVADLLKTQDEVMTRTRGVSMRPLLRQGRDIVVIKRPKFPLKAGDVPVYCVNGKKELVMHRILKAGNDGVYIIRGDNLFVKEYVAESQIVGVMKAFYRDGKYCDCEKSRKYSLYIILNRATYPARYLWKCVLRPMLAGVYKKIFRRESLTSNTEENIDKK